MLKYYSPRYQQLRPKSYIMDQLTMLSQREQLMEDIDCIIEGELDGIISVDLSNELVRRLCDAVCKNFPV